MTWIKFTKDTDVNHKEDIVDVGQEVADEHIKAKVAKEFDFAAAEEEKRNAPEVVAVEPTPTPAIVDAEIVE
jgi:hypothetical protein